MMITLRTLSVIGIEIDSLPLKRMRKRSRRSTPTQDMPARLTASRMAAVRILTSVAGLWNRRAGRTRNSNSSLRRVAPPSCAMSGRINAMAKLTLVYGMRLLPSEEIEEVGAAPVKLKNGREANVTLHIVEGSKDDIEKQLRQSIDAFFDLYPEI